DADSVSVIDTSTDQEIERIDVRLAENALPGASPEGIALSADERTLYVANAHSNAIAVVALSPKARPGHAAGKMKEDAKSKILGFIPTGQYPSAVAVADGKLFVGNGKGTGFEPSSMRVSNSGFTPNPPNAKFPPQEEKNRQGGQYSGSIVSGNISMVSLPEEPALARCTQQAVTPNHHALAQRFGLFDRFFVNSEASPDGHNWATAAFSTDYVDKGFRWEYSNRGRTYDWEGYNRLPDYEPPGDLQLGKFKGDVLAALADLLEKHLPYRQGFTDLA